MIKKASLAIAALAAALAASMPAHAGAVTDCPLRDTPFSIKSPLLDVLLSPAANAALDKASPTKAEPVRGFFSNTQVPTFTAIVTPEVVANFAGMSADQLATLDKDLKALPVTKADKVARCARYDNDIPTFDPPAGKPRILLFEKMVGFRDGPSVDAAHKAFMAMADRNGWAMVPVEKAGAINARTLRQFDAIIWNNISGDVLTLAQRKALRKYLEKGGAFIAVHGSAGDPVYFWDWYADTLIGARFKGHPADPQFQDARIEVNKQHPLAKNLPDQWTMKDEWYSFSTNPRAVGANVILTLDEKTYVPESRQGDLRMGDHPIAWTNCLGKGQMFYSAIGHMPETYSDPRYVTLLEDAIRWATDPGTTCGK